MKRALFTAVLLTLGMGASMAIAEDSAAVSRVGAFPKGGPGIEWRQAREEAPPYQLTGKAAPAGDKTRGESEAARQNVPAWDMYGHNHH